MSRAGLVPTSRCAAPRPAASVACGGGAGVFGLCQGVLLYEQRGEGWPPRDQDGPETPRCGFLLECGIQRPEPARLARVPTAWTEAVRATLLQVHLTSGSFSPKAARPAERGPWDCDGGQEACPLGTEWFLGPRPPRQSQMGVKRGCQGPGHKPCPTHGQARKTRDSRR